jgi:hypothetical protein
MVTTGQPTTPVNDAAVSASQLPGLKRHVPTLWEEKPPGPGATVRAVEAMLEA